MVKAMKAPDSGNLDRIQIVKGFYRDGHPRETVYNVAWSDNRNIDSITVKLPPVGNTVYDSKHATFISPVNRTE